MILCVDENMRLWLYANVVLRVSGDVDLYGYGLVWLLVCLLVRWHVGLLSAYRPLVPQEHSPPLLVERGEESVSFYPFCYQFCKICSVFT